MATLPYIFSVGIIYTALFLVYFLLFRNNTHFQFHRVYLLLIIPLAFILPLVSVGFAYDTSYHTTLPVFEYSNAIAHAMSFNWKNLVGYGYLTISLGFFVRLMLHLKNTLKTIDAIKKGQKNDIQPFSFFSFIYVSKSLPTENREAIYLHEKVHASQLHSLDVLVYELAKIVLWWNPFLWVGINSIKSNHEFIADKLASEKADKYSSVLVAQLLGVNCSMLTNNFKSKPLIKKRIMMMKTKKSNRLSVFKYALVVPVIGISLAATNPVKNSNHKWKNIPQQNAEKVYDKVDVMPEFEGGKEGLMHYLGANIKYPEEAKANKIEGKVLVRFVVDAQGSVKAVNVPQPVHPLLDKEAMRVIKAMPNWIPGKKDGKAVSVQYTLPIQFKHKR